MEYVMLVTEDKNLLTTKAIPLYKGEKNVDRIKILFPKNCLDTTPTLQIILPDGKTGKVKVCNFEEELYKDHLVVFVNVIDELTAYAGDMKMWFTLFGNTQDSTMKTDFSCIEVLDHEGFSSLTPDSDVDVVSAITELKVAVEKLKTSKADDLEIDNETNKLRLLSGDDLLAEVDLPQEVEWSSWNE